MGQFQQIAPLYEKVLYLSTYWAAKCATCGHVDDAQRLLQVAQDEAHRWPLPTPAFGTFWDLRGFGMVIEASVFARKGRLRQAARLLRQALAQRLQARRQVASTPLARINLAAVELLLNKPMAAHEQLAAVTALDTLHDLRRDEAGPDRVEADTTRAKLIRGVPHHLLDACLADRIGTKIRVRQVTGDG